MAVCTHSGLINNISDNGCLIMWSLFVWRAENRKPNQNNITDVTGIIKLSNKLTTNCAWFLRCFWTFHTLIFYDQSTSRPMSYLWVRYVFSLTDATSEWLARHYCKVMMMMSWCLMSSDVMRHIRDNWVVTNAEARCNKSLRPRKPEGSLGRTAQDVHLDFHTAPELWLQS